VDGATWNSPDMLDHLAFELRRNRTLRARAQVGARTRAVPIDMVDKRERQPSKNSFGLIAQWEESGNSPQPGTRLNYGINQLYQADPDNAALARTTAPEYCAFP
jgi:hypothetical protein